MRRSRRERARENKLDCCCQTYAAAFTRYAAELVFHSARGPELNDVIIVWDPGTTKFCALGPGGQEVLVVVYPALFDEMLTYWFVVVVVVFQIRSRALSLSLS